MAENGVHAARDHANDAKGEHQVHHMAAGDQLHADDAVEDLNEQEDIGLADDAGEHRAGRGRGIPVGVRQPGMEGVQGAFDAQTHEEQAHDDGDGRRVFARCGQLHQRIMDVFHEQVAGEVVGDGDGDQGQAGAQQAHNHVAHGRDHRAAVLPRHDERAGRERHDFDKDIRGEQVVGVEHAHHGGQHQVQHDAHDIDLLAVHLLGELAHAAQYAEQHDEAEDHRQRGFQHARAQLVAPGSGEVAHPVDVAFAVAPHEEGQPQVQRRDRRGKPRRHPLGHAARQHGAENARHHAQHDGEEGDILYKLHISRPLPSS